MTFFHKLLPAAGLKCVATALPKGGFRHYFYETIEAAASQAEYLDQQGHTVYLAQAGFDPKAINEAVAHNSKLPKGLPLAEWRELRKKERSQENAAYFKNFFLDIDCGKEKFEKNPNTAYETQKDAVASLKQFIEETGLPFPAVVNSGNGLYAHWLLDEEVTVAQWTTVARIFKNVIVAYKFKIDPNRTSDSASVLRPPGTTNRKNGAAKRVALLRDAEPVGFMDFVRQLHKAAKAKQLDTTPLAAPKPQKDINADFYSGLDGPRPSAEKISQKCGQLQFVVGKEGAVEEPLWYAMIGLVSFCEPSEAEADDLIHLWSSGHPEYSFADTQAKIEQFRSANVGPPTCSHLGSLNSQPCVGCKYNGKLKSPIGLGRPEPANAPIVQTEDETPPDGFRRAEDGLYCEREGIWTKFYDRDLYPTRLSFDASLGYEVCTVQHNLPHEGDMTFTFRSAIVHDVKAFVTCLMDNHVKMVGTREKAMMAAYMESYLQKLQRQRRMTNLLCQMGWREDVFVLGKKIFHRDGSMDDAALARNVPEAAQAFRSEGDLTKWREMTRIFGEQHMEPYAFAFLCGFGAPLMKFTGFAGGLVSMVGPSGAGKTLTERIMLSIYGYHSDLMMYKEDTRNALVNRLGVYGTLPLAVDEVTNFEGMDLSDLAYRVTQGRDKARLTKNSEEKRNINGWNTIAVVSANSSIVEKLSALKADASAEINRVFEYGVTENPVFCGETTAGIYWTIDENYGMAGEAYVRWLVMNAAKLKPGIDQVRQKIDAQAGVRGEERFWSAMASAALYGGAIAKALGLIDFNVARVMEWVTKTIKSMRSDKDELAGTAVDVLGQFLDENAHNRLVVKSDNGPGKPCVPVDLPRGQLVIRHEIEGEKLYISRQVFSQWIAKRYGSYRKIAEELKAIGALKNANVRKVLGAGVMGGAQQPCWLIDLRCPQLGHVGLTLVQEAQMLEKGVENV